MKRNKKRDFPSFRRHVFPRHSRTRSRKRQRQHSDDEERTGLHSTMNEPPRTTTVQPPPHHEQPVAQASGFRLSNKRLLHTTTSKSSKSSSPHTHGLSETPLSSTPTPPPPTASLSAVPPLGRGFFPLGQSARGHAPWAWRGAKEIIPRYQAPTFSHLGNRRE